MSNEKKKTNEEEKLVMCTKKQPKQDLLELLFLLYIMRVHDLELVKSLIVGLNRRLRASYQGGWGNVGKGYKKKLAKKKRSL